LGAAAVAYIRKIHNITPLWNSELEIISGGVKLVDIEEPLKSLQKCIKYKIINSSC
jgi:hypothetical protein